MSSFGCVMSFSRYLVLKLVISALTVGICRSVCGIVFGTYRGALAIDRSDILWNLRNILVYENMSGFFFILWTQHTDRRCVITELPSNAGMSVWRIVFAVCRFMSDMKSDERGAVQRVYFSCTCVNFASVYLPFRLYNFTVSRNKRCTKRCYSRQEEIPNTCPHNTRVLGGIWQTYQNLSLCLPKHHVMAVKV